MSRGILLVALMLALGSSPLRAETIRVTIDKLVFAPAEIKARVGDTIQWINKDVIPHTATMKGGWDVLIPAGKSATMIVSKAEDVGYFCRFHPNMKGRLIAAP
jgi:plastocyanin